MRFILVSLIIFGFFINGCSEDKTKASTEKVIESKPTPKLEWITPSSDVCKKNNGKVVANACKEYKGDAGSICIAMGGRLPTIDELKQVVKECGGVPTDDLYTKAVYENQKNSFYRSCYKDKGFNAPEYCSSSYDKPFDIKHPEIKIRNLVISFGLGITSSGRNGKCYIRCIKNQ